MKVWIEDIGDKDENDGLTENMIERFPEFDFDRDNREFIGMFASARLDGKHHDSLIEITPEVLLEVFETMGVDDIGNFHILFHNLLRFVCIELMREGKGFEDKE